MIINFLFAIHERHDLTNNCRAIILLIQRSIVGINLISPAINMCDFRFHLLHPQREILEGARRLFVESFEPNLRNYAHRNGRRRPRRSRTIRGLLYISRAIGYPPNDSELSN